MKSILSILTALLITSCSNPPSTVTPIMYNGDIIYIIADSSTVVLPPIIINKDPKDNPGIIPFHLNSINKVNNTAQIAIGMP